MPAEEPVKTEDQLPDVPQKEPGKFVIFCVIFEVPGSSPLSKIFHDFGFWSIIMVEAPKSCPLLTSHDSSYIGPTFMICDLILTEYP